MPSFKKSLIVEQFQRNYLKLPSVATKARLLSVFLATNVARNFKGSRKAQ